MCGKRSPYLPRFGRGLGPGKSGGGFFTGMMGTKSAIAVGSGPTGRDRLGLVSFAGIVGCVTFAQSGASGLVANFGANCDGAGRLPRSVTKFIVMEYCVGGSITEDDDDAAGVLAVALDKFCKFEAGSGFSPM